MKRTQTNDTSRPPNKRAFRRPTTISVGESDTQETERYLGAKTKGTIEFAEKQQHTTKKKKPFGKFEYGNYQGYYT